MAVGASEMEDAAAGGKGIVLRAPSHYRIRSPMSRKSGETWGTRISAAAYALGTTMAVML